MMEETTGKNTCGCVHHKFMSILVVAFGLLFLLGELDVVNADMVKLGWPILVIVGGVLKLGQGKCKCC